MLRHVNVMALKEKQKEQQQNRITIEHDRAGQKQDAAK